ncbi:MAG: ABC transporter permease [Anaerolineales bacterium]|nr:ABC transporter permease [Anaerolineales bacterium]MBK8822691.1 ABC transporter permease [Anaerolineales bacterium]
MKGYQEYFLRKLGWFLITFVFAFLLNFILPRMMPGDPVAVITQRVTQGMTSQTGVAKIYQEYSELFGTNKPMLEQFFLYVKNVSQGNFGISFSQYPRPVAEIIKSSIWWTVCLQFPAIIVGWLIGNTLGALAAYLKGGFDKVIMPVSIFVSNFPAFGMAIIMVVIFATTLKWFPISGGYGFDQIPNMSWTFVWSVIVHYQLPFWSIVLISIGGQAIGMRSMSIYELNADYVKYSRFLGINDRKIVGYVFRNAMLPQVTGLALSIGTMVGGALVAEIIFSYPGLGNTILKAVVGQDYPLISGVTLIITLMVLSANFIIEIIYGIIDPRIKATQAD